LKSLPASTGLEPGKAGFYSITENIQVVSGGDEISPRATHPALLVLEARLRTRREQVLHPLNRETPLTALP